MIEIRYSENQTLSDICGSWKDFAIFRQLLLHFLDGSKEIITIETNRNANSDGWDFVLENLEINQKGESVCISVSENRNLKIKGSKQNLRIFADWFESDENTISGYHSHYEYFDGNEYVDSKSIPLIIRNR
jgi:hypothetical protein